MRSRKRAVALLHALLFLGCAGDPDGRCTAEIVALLPDRISEASGIAASRSQPDLLWVHNDSEGSAQLYGLGTDGHLRVEIPVPDVRNQSDWEDIAVGPCPQNTCIYIGDIGDNMHDREDRAILRMREPAEGDTVAGSIERFPIRYPDHPRDAEAIFVLPDTSVWIISKGRRDRIVLYRYPPPLRPDVPVVLEPVQRLSSGLVQLDQAVTGASASVDGATVAIRTYSTVRLYTFSIDSLELLWEYSIEPLAEPQGEGVALALDGSIHLVSEAGLDDEAAPLSRLRCTAR